MEDTTTTLNLRRMQYLSAFVLLEAVIERGVAAWRLIKRPFAAFAERQRQARARLELHRLSDHALKDIGVERDQIDRLFH